MYLLSFVLFDLEFFWVAAKFDNMANLLQNPDFISKLSQEFFVSNNSTTWFKLKLRNGRLVDVTFLLTLHINWVKIINRTHYTFDFLIVGYIPGCNQRRKVISKYVKIGEFMLFADDAKNYIYAKSKKRRLLNWHDTHVNVFI